MVTVIAGPMFNVTAIMRDKGKKLRIRRAKESADGTILSLTASQLVVRPAGKQDTISGRPVLLASHHYHLFHTSTH